MAIIEKTAADIKELIGKLPYPHPNLNFNHGYAPVGSYLREHVLPIRMALAHIHKRGELFEDLEERFCAFLKKYFPNTLVDISMCSREPIFTHWFFNQEKGLPYALPGLNAANKSMAEHWKAHSVLLLFFWQQLVSLGVLEPDKRVDEQIFYCTDLVDNKCIEQAMNNDNLFVETCWDATIHHGKYSHLLQLILICLLQKKGELSDKLFHPKNLIKRMNATVKYENQPYTPWRLCLDGAIKGSLYGAGGLNIFMLSNFALELCPTLHRFFGLHYIKQIKKSLFRMKKYNTDFQTDELLIEHLITDVILFHHNGDTDAWKKKYHASPTVADDQNPPGMFYKKNRSSMFTAAERAIIKNHH